MEILFPAGSLDYVYAAKECGANAVYGGLKLWNARNKATNFTIKELEKAINFCRTNNLKFYLTLNTLLFDDEIKLIVDTLHSLSILPDAFICADIGLILQLKLNFPDIPIHASTQFGAHNIDDIKFLESLGVKRVILARELTKEEILKIKESTSLELEMFVWGTQCLSFSGSCFLGSLCNGGTANRGKCITMCRNRYSINEQIGNYFYVPDLYAINYILPVESIKIEGRRRKISELKQVVYELKNGTSGKRNNGFVISASMNKNNLYEKVNSRFHLLYNYNPEIKYDENDVFVDLNDFNELKYLNPPKTTSKYVYTEIKQNFEPEQNNVSIEVIESQDDVAKKILLINSKGEAHYFYSDTNDKAIRIENFAETLRLGRNYNLYSLKYIKNYQDQQLYFTSKTSCEIINFLDKIYPGSLQIPSISSQIKNIVVETESFFMAQKLSDEGHSVILNLTTMEALELVNPKEFNSRVSFKLPFFNFENVDIEKCCKKFRNRAIVFTKFSQVLSLKSLNLKKRICDYLVPVWNTYTKKFLLSLGIDEFCCSPELSDEKNRELFSDVGHVFLLAGAPACAFTRICFKNGFVCQDCNAQLKTIENIDNGMTFIIKCHADYRTVHYKRKILNCFDNTYSNESFRYVCLDETYEQIEENVKIFAHENYFKEIKNNDCWRDSFCSLLKEDVKIEN